MPGSVAVVDGQRTGVCCVKSTGTICRTSGELWQSSFYWTEAVVDLSGEDFGMTAVLNRPIRDAKLRAS